MLPGQLTFRYKDINGICFRVGCSASVIAGIAVCGVVDDEATMGLGTRLRAYTDTSSRCVVVDHVFVVIPEHVLWWGRALKQDIKWHIGCEQDNTLQVCTTNGSGRLHTLVSHVQLGTKLCVCYRNFKRAFSTNDYSPQYNTLCPLVLSPVIRCFTSASPATYFASV
jgi:hypothetical protein